jgi:purine-binding chemotaxis protein CheW
LANLVRSQRGRRPLAHTRAQGTVVEYLAFRLGRDVYAVPVTSVHEIVKPPVLTPVPRAPSYVLGIISGRGRVVTVVDARRKLRLEEQPTTPRSRVLIAEGAQERIGLWVDEVLLVYRFGDAEIERSLLGPSGEMGDYITGIARPAENTVDVVILLDVKALLA